MGGAVVILFFLPWLDHSPVKSIRYRPTWHKCVYGSSCSSSWCSATSARSRRPPAGDAVAQIGTLIYFGFFLLMPWWSRAARFKQVPERVTFQVRTEPSPETTR